MPEYVYAALSHGNSLLKKERDIKKALELQASLAVLCERFAPVGRDTTEAQAKAQLWEGSFPGKEMLPIVLQELYFLLESSSRFGGFEELYTFQANLFQLIVSYYESHPEDIWGDTFFAKIHTKSHTQRSVEVHTRETYRRLHELQVPPEEKEREAYVHSAMELGIAAWKTARYNLVWTLQRVQSILSKKNKQRSKENLHKILENEVIMMASDRESSQSRG